MIGFIYFVRQQEPYPRYKIGFSADVKKRISCLRTGNPEPIELVGHIRGSRGQERGIHEVLKPYRVTGEWYQNIRPVTALIEDAMLYGAQYAISVARDKNVEREWGSESIQPRKQFKRDMQRFVDKYGN